MLEVKQRYTGTMHNMKGGAGLRMVVRKRKDNGARTPRGSEERIQIPIFLCGCAIRGLVLS